MTINIGVDLTAALINGEFAALLTALGGLSTVDTTETRSSAVYGALATAGPAVTLTSVGTRALVFVSCRTWDATASVNEGCMGVAVSGATAISASDSAALIQNGATAVSGGGVGIESGMLIPINITAGSNTFTALYRSPAATVHSFAHRKMFVFAP